MFALAPAPSIMGKQMLERRTLTFGKGGQDGRPKGAMDDVMEIQVFRSTGRKRIVPDPQEMPQSLTSNSPYRLAKSNNASRAGATQPGRGNGVE